MSTSRRFTRRLSLAAGGAVLSSALLLYLNYRYVSSTVNLDDERNPLLAWAPWSGLALLLGVALGVAAMLLAVGSATRRHSALAARLAAPVIVLGTMGVFYARYTIQL